ncbi:MAG: hypothetical protein ACLUOI_09060 [Eisenbergiella sp.]
MMVLITPVLGESISIRIPPNTTHDMKCGRYIILCEIFLKPLDFTSFRKIAKIIGIGNPKITLPAFRSSVFLKMIKKLFPVNSLLKCSNPTHLLSKNPVENLKS